MLKKVLIRWAVLTVAVGAAAAIVPGVDIHGGFLTLLWVALLFGLVNAIIGPFLRLLALPFTLLTLGVFALVVNGILVAITAGLSSKFDVGGFFSAFVAALVISLVSMLLNRVTTSKRRTH
ncbi:MAG: putative rane protein [Actinomycetota bacterium]|jgi:putative membrane protein|nr:putative rane protein [Actinomycetota bacterium]